MDRSDRYFSPSEAAKRLGVSAKALRLYEQRGLLSASRTSAGWRIYGPAEMDRARQIVALRDLGLSLSQVKRVMLGETKDLDPALAAHQHTLEVQARWVAGTIERIRTLRQDLAADKLPAAADLFRLGRSATGPSLALDLPWPWGGESFELFDLRPITYIIGPLGSGKTRLAQAIARTLTDAAFIGLDRLTDGSGNSMVGAAADPEFRERVDRIVARLVQDDAAASPALFALISALESAEATILVVDMVERGLDQPSQEAVIAYLRHSRDNQRPLFLMTRSSSILDLDHVGPDEAILFCPANHSPPTLVDPRPGAPGYEAVATCLATPNVRTRTEGAVAWRPEMT